MSRNDTKEEKQMALDQVIDLELEVLRLRDELAKVTRQRDAMVKRAREIWDVREWNDCNWSQGQAAQEILAAGEAEKEE